MPRVIKKKMHEFPGRAIAGDEKWLELYSGRRRLIAIARRITRDEDSAVEIADNTISDLATEDLQTDAITLRRYSVARVKFAALQNWSKKLGTPTFSDLEAAHAWQAYNGDDTSEALEYQLAKRAFHRAYKSNPEQEVVTYFNQLRRLIGRLPKKYRLFFGMLLDGLAPPEIARELRMKLDEVFQLQREARDALWRMAEV